MKIVDFDRAPYQKADGRWVRMHQVDSATWVEVAAEAPRRVSNSNETKKGSKFSTAVETTAEPAP